MEGRLGKMAYFEFSEDSELNLLILRHKTLFTAMRFSEVKPAAVTQEAHSGTWIFVGVYMNFMIQKCYNSRVRLSLAVYNSYQKKKALIPQSQSPFCYQQSSFRFHPLMTAWNLCRLVFIAFSNFLSCSFSEIRGRKRALCILRVALVPLPACWDLPFMYFFNAFRVSWPSYADPCLSVPYASCFRARKNSDERTTN